MICRTERGGTMREKVYLGDSVYVTRDGYGIILTTENEISNIEHDNIIYLDSEVIAALERYLIKIRITEKGDEQ
jgi:hypothetical protein